MRIKRPNQTRKLPFGSPFGQLTKVLTLLFATLMTSNAWAQLSITAKNTPFTVDFTNTVANVNNGTFNAAANVAIAAPGAGQLDSDAWSFVDDGAVSSSAAVFGGTPTTNGKGTLLSGAAINSATGQGWYAQNVGGTGDIALYWQPQAGFATSGMVTLRVTNNTGSTINNIDLSYRIREINNRNGTNGIKLFRSTDNVTYTAVSSVDYTSVDGEPSATINITGVTRGASTVITHASNANSAINVNDIVFFNNSVNGITQLRRMSGVVTAKTATTTTVNINSSAFSNWTSNGQFTRVTVLETVRTTSITTPIANGSSVFFRWFLDGAGEDELSIDDISMVADAEGLVITNPNVSTVIDFDNTLTNVNNGTFTATATISAATPVAGQLNNAAWSFVNDAAGTPTDFASTFGVNGTGGQGTSTGTVTTTGWYGFDVPDPNSLAVGNTRTLGWQSNTGFATDGAVTLKITNNTGTTVQDFRISYNVWELNNTAVANRVRAYLSTTNDGTAGSYVLVPNSTHSGTGAASGSPAWVGALYTLTGRSAIPALSIPNGGSLFLRFYIDNNGTNAEGDEIALDDIAIVASVAPLTSINPNRDIIWAYDGFDYYETLQQVTDVDNDGVNDGTGFKGVATVFSNFGPAPIPLHGVTTNTQDARYNNRNGYSTLGWAGDWLSSSNPAEIDDAVNFANFFDINVTAGQDAGIATAVKPTIPITSASEQRSLVNSGMYVEGGNGQVIGRRLQTSTAGYAFQYTATNTTTYGPCLSVSGDCPAISAVRHINSVKSVTHVTQNTNGTGAGTGTATASRWSHTQNTRIGAEGSTVWVGVMLRKNFNDSDPVFISLHRNTDVFNTATANAIQVGYFGGTNADGTDADGFRHWGVRVNGTLTKGTTVNSRITTAQMINAGLAGQPDGTSLEERVFDLLVVRIDFAEGTAASANTTGADADNTYATNHRIRLYVIRDVARDNDSPNIEAYPAVPNPAGYSLDQGTILDHLSDAIADTDGNAVDDFVQHVDVNTTVAAATDISFNALAYSPGANPDASAMDEFRMGGSFNQAALNSPVISLIRGLCSANGGTIGLQSYQGGSFGEALCLDTNGNPVACAGGTVTQASATTSGTQEIYDAAINNVWGSAVPNSTLYNTYDGSVHPSYPNDATANHVVRAGGATLLYNGGPTYNKIGGAYTYQLNIGSGPNDNYFLIGTQTRHSFGPAWVGFYDNSPNRNGYLMSINAAYARGKFFDQTITGLCADTQYEFSVDIINVLRESRTITSWDPITQTYGGAVNVATTECDPVLEPGCGQFSSAGSTGSSVGLGSVTRGGTNLGNDQNFSLNPEIDFALNDSPIYTVPVSIPNDKQWHRVGLTFVTKANLSQAINLSMRNLAPGGAGNDLAIDNISFRPCGSYSRLIDENTVCANSGGATDGRIQTIIGKAGNSYSNSKVRFQKWTPFAYPISHLITGVTNTGTPTIITVANGGGANDFAGTYRIPVGAEVAMFDLTGLPIDNTTAIVTAKTANTVTIGVNNTVAYPGNTGVLRVTALPSALIVSISQTNPVVVTLSGTTGDDIALNTFVSFSGITGMTQINGLAGKVTAKTSNTITIGSINASAFSAYTGSATERIAISHPSDDLDGDGIADEIEWIDMDFNPYDGKNYTVVDVVTMPTQYETALIPITPVALPRAITQYNVFYSNGTNFRSMFAGNEANLLDESGKCRFIIPGFQTNCSILPAAGGRLRAKNTEDGIQLIWNSFQENAEVKYILERSYDAKNFVEIASYSALNKDEYKHLDGAPFVGKNYYRIKIVEGNGKFYYTNVASADWGNKAALSIYPNPANDRVNVTFSSDFTQDQAVTVRVLNMMGSQVRDKNYTLANGERTLEINTQDIPEGLYLLEIKIGDLDKVVHKMVIKR